MRTMDPEVLDEALNFYFSIESSRGDREAMKNTNVEKGVIFHDEDSLVEELRGMDLQFIDKRRKGGCLWVVGGAELDSVMNKFAGRGIRFIFIPNGGRATKKKPGWFTKWRE